jgi:hypothetical protein
MNGRKTAHIQGNRVWTVDTVFFGRVFMCIYSFMYFVSYCMFVCVTIYQLCTITCACACEYVGVYVVRILETGASFDEQQVSGSCKGERVRAVDTVSCVCVCVCVCMYVLYICTYCMVDMCACMHFMYVRTHVCMHACIHTCIVCVVCVCTTERRHSYSHASILPGKT